MEAHSVTGPAKNLLEFAQRGRPEVEFVIAAYRRGNEEESPFIAAARAAGLPVEVIPERGRFDLGVPGEMRRMVERWKPDIIQTHNIKSHFFLRISGVWHRTTWLAFHHGFTNEDWKMRLYNATSQWSFRAARRAVTVCQPFVEQLVARGLKRESVVVRPNAVRPYEKPGAEVVEAVRRETGIPEGSRVLVAVGRLSREKGHADLVEAIAQLRVSEVILVIVGEGGERSALESQAASAGLEGRVRMVGHQADVRPYYEMADVFVLPSHSEGSPNVLLEAMSAGCACVATRVGGVPETVTDGNTALVVPARDPGSMAQAIQRLLDDPELRARLGGEAKRAAEGFSPEQYCASMVALYRSVLAEARA